MSEGSNVTYMRWQRDEPRRGHVFDALPADHPTAGVPCAVCDRPLGAGPVQLVVIGPPADDADAQTRHDAGRWYSALAVIVHGGCAGGMSDGDLAAFVENLTPQTEADR